MQVKLRPGIAIDSDQAVRVLVLGNQVPRQIDLQFLHLLEKRKPSFVRCADLLNLDQLVFSLMFQVLSMLRFASGQFAIMLKMGERLIMYGLSPQHRLTLGVALGIPGEFQVG